MSYHTGSINSTTPNTDLMTALDTHIAGHAAWEFVEEVTSGTKVTRVYKCLGSVNSFGVDFYIGTCRSATSGAAFGFICGETYNATTKKFGNGAARCAYNTAITLDSTYNYSTEMHVADETTLVAATDGFLRAAGGLNVDTGISQTASTDYLWVMSVSNDRIVFGHGANRSAYVGLYDSFHNTTLDPFPLYCGTLGFSVAGSAYIDVYRSTSVREQGAFTRDSRAGSATQALAGSVSGQPWTWPGAGLNGRGALLNITKETISQKWWPSRAMLFQVGNAGALKGLLKDVRWMMLAETTEAIFDTATIDGVDYTCLFTGTSGGLGQSTSVQLATCSLWVSQAA